MRCLLLSQAASRQIRHLKMIVLSLFRRGDFPISLELQVLVLVEIDRVFLLLHLCKKIGLNLKLSLSPLFLCSLCMVVLLHHVVCGVILRSA